MLFFSAAGLNLVWGVLGVMNFAAGSVYMLGAYLATSVIARLGASALGWLVALIAVPLAVAALGAVAEVALLRRTYRAQDENQQFMLTLALSYLIAAGVVLVFGTHFRTVSLPGCAERQLERAGRDAAAYTVVTIVLRPAGDGARSGGAVPHARRAAHARGGRRPRDARRRWAWTWIGCIRPCSRSGSGWARSAAC